MAQIVYRANLSSAGFPLLSRQQGRTVIARQQDQNYVPNIASPESQDKGAGVPQAYYMHNVMPTYEGYASVGYNQKVAATLLAGQPVGTFKQIFPVQDGSLRAYFAYTSDDFALLYRAPYFEWSFTSSFGGIGNASVTHATVGGQTFMCIKRPGHPATVMRFHLATNTINLVTLTGLDMNEILGIFASNGYLLAYTATSVAWSSTVDVTDFEPSLSTGAGGGSVEHLRGSITFAIGGPLGFTLFSDKNAVAGAYSGNSRYPFNFRELINSGGVFEASDVSYLANTSAMYAYTTSGLQAMSIQKAETVFAEITDFISGREFEDFDETAKQFSVTVGQRMLRKVAYISDRYLVISYGINSLTHALVVDTALKRYGKLKIDHVQCFEWLEPTQFAFESAKESIAFLQADGRVVTVSMSGAANGVLILGKYQYLRQRLITLQHVELESINDWLSDYDFNLYVQAPISDGLYGQFNSMSETASNLRYKKYSGYIPGINASLLLMGAFDLSSLILTFTLHGRR